MSEPGMTPFSGRLLCTAAFLLLFGPWAIVRADDLRELGSAQIPPIPAGKDDAEIRQLFEAEYPAAYERLRSAVARIRGSILIDDLYQKGQAGSGSQRQTFSRFDDHVIFRATESKQDTGFAGQGALVTPGEAAQVSNANTESAAVSFAADKPNWRMKILYDDRIRGFLDATYSCYGDDGIQQELQRGSFQYLAGYRHPARSDLVVVSFNYSREYYLPGRQGKGTATVVFNTAKDWAIEQFENFWTAPSEMVIRGIVASSVVKGLGRVPSTVLLEHYYELKAGSSPGEINDSPLFRRTKAIVSELQPVENFSTDEFSLAALGVPDGRPRPWWILFTAGTLVLLLMAIGYPMIRRRSRSAVQRSAAEFPETR